jgi:hypothetical protein
MLQFILVQARAWATPALNRRNPPRKNNWVSLAILYNHDKGLYIVYNILVFFLYFEDVMTICGVK